MRERERERERLKNTHSDGASEGDAQRCGETEGDRPIEGETEKQPLRATGRNTEKLGDGAEGGGRYEYRHPKRNREDRQMQRKQRQRHTGR